MKQNNSMLVSVGVMDSNLNTPMLVDWPGGVARVIPNVGRALCFGSVEQDITPVPLNVFVVRRHTQT